LVFFGDTKQTINQPLAPEQKQRPNATKKLFSPLGKKVFEKLVFVFASGKLKLSFNALNFAQN
jgi:hypothetical protein